MTSSVGNDGRVSGVSTGTITSGIVAPSCCKGCSVGAERRNKRKSRKIAPMAKRIAIRIRIGAEKSAVSDPKMSDFWAETA